MPTNFPAAFDTLGNPPGDTSTNNPAFLHSVQHANANDAIEALQAKVGTTAQANSRVHVGPVAPEGPGPYLWWQTFEDGSMTLWIEDGS